MPGTTSVPSILDGAKRDRAIWAGDMNVEGPTVYYSTGQSAYLKGALQLLGSYQLSSGFVTGDLPPQDPLHTGANQSGTTGSYSASYSIYWLLGLGAYYLYTGDTAFAAQEWPVVQAELAWNASQLDSSGLLVTNGSDGDGLGLLRRRQDRRGHRVQHPVLQGPAGRGGAGHRRGPERPGRDLRPAGRGAQDGH